MTYKEGDHEVCFGFLMNFTGNGIYEPNFGRMPVSPQEADIHNRLLSEGSIKGLDENCKVGMMGTFYVGKNGEQPVVQTWTGEEVSRDVEVHGQTITFRRKGKTFRGRLHKDADYFGFKRIQ